MHLRGRVVREEKSRLTPEALAMKGMAAAFATRRRYEGAQRLARLGRGPLAKAAIPGWTAMRDLPTPPKETFRDWWQHREPRPRRRATRSWAVMSAGGRRAARGRRRPTRPTRRRRGLRRPRRVTATGGAP